MTADHWVGQVEIFDHRLQFTLVLFGHFAPEDRSDLVGLPDVSIQIQQPLGDFIYRCPAMEDEVVAILHLRKEKTMLASGLLAFLVRNERGERCQPFLTTLQQVPRGERVGEFLQAQRMATLQEGVGTRLKIDSLFPHANRQPVVLVEADSRGKWEIGTHAHLHPAPVRIVHVEVIWIHPALLVLQMRAMVVLVPHRHQDACWLPGLQDRHHLVGFGILEILLHELVSPALVVIARGSIQKRNAPFFGSVLEPILELIGAFRQAPPGDPFPLPIGVEKAKPALAWLERLSPSIQPHAIQAAVPELKAILVMLDEGVHSPLLCGERPGAYRRERLRGQRSLYGLMGYQGRSPWLVRKAPGILTHLRDVKHGILLASMF